MKEILKQNNSHIKNKYTQLEITILQILNMKTGCAMLPHCLHIVVHIQYTEITKCNIEKKYMYQERACCLHAVWMLYLLFTYFNIMLILFMSVEVTNGKPLFSPQILHCIAGGLGYLGTFSNVFTNISSP